MVNEHDPTPVVRPYHRLLPDINIHEAIGGAWIAIEIWWWSDDAHPVPTRWRWWIQMIAPALAAGSRGEVWRWTRISWHPSRLTSIITCGRSHLAVAGQRASGGQRRFQPFLSPPPPPRLLYRRFPSNWTSIRQGGHSRHPRFIYFTRSVWFIDSPGASSAPPSHPAIDSTWFQYRPEIESDEMYLGRTSGISAEWCRPMALISVTHPTSSWTHLTASISSWVSVASPASPASVVVQSVDAQSDTCWHHPLPRLLHPLKFNNQSNINRISIRISIQISIAADRMVSRQRNLKASVFPNQIKVIESYDECNAG